jgi:hypothetical protein
MPEVQCGINKKITNRIKIKEEMIMPGRNGTGPRGMGPMTGRGMGFCAVSETQGYTNTGAGQGFGTGTGRGRSFCGRGGGRGWRNMFNATGLPGWMRFRSNTEQNYGSDPETEKQALRNQAGILQSQLDQIKKRLDEFEIKDQSV